MGYLRVSEGISLNLIFFGLFSYISSHREFNQKYYVGSTDIKILFLLMIELNLHLVLN